MTDQTPTWAGLLTHREAAGYLHVHINTLRRWAQNGDIKSFQVGERGDRRYRLADLDSFIAGVLVEPEQPDPGAQPAPYIPDSSDTLDAALGLLAECLPALLKAQQCALTQDQRTAWLKLRDQVTRFLKEQGGP